MKNKEYTWYVEPLDANTNGVVSREIGDENFQRDLPDKDGVLRKVWECPWPFVASLQRNKVQMNLQFFVFVREGHGKMRSAAFLQRRRQSSPRRAA